MNKDMQAIANEAMSAARNSTGYYRVTKIKYKNGFAWRYQYYDDNWKRKAITSVSLEKLEQKVKDRGLPWKKFF